MTYINSLAKAAGARDESLSPCWSSFSSGERGSGSGSSFRWFWRCCKCHRKAFKFLWAREKLLLRDEECVARTWVSSKKCWSFSFASYFIQTKELDARRILLQNESTLVRKRPWYPLSIYGSRSWPLIPSFLFPKWKWRKVSKFPKPSDSGRKWAQKQKAKLDLLSLKKFRIWSFFPWCEFSRWAARKQGLK